MTSHALDARYADSLASSGIGIEGLDALAAALPREAVDPAIRWVAAERAARLLARDIETATARVHQIVEALKGFTFMDRPAAPEQVDVARGLADTRVMLESKARGKAVDVQLEVAADLPRVRGFGSELNQIWEKLIDNAIDAVGVAGHVSVTASVRSDSIVVRVADDGPGIAAADRDRIFDPFFTTKPVGKGTGLGLYLARRLVLLHRGDIEVTSQPGRTVFRVRLPIAPRSAASSAAE